MLPTITEEYQSTLRKLGEDEAYAIPAAIDVASPMPVQKFADKPVEAKLVPSFVIVGWSESLSLLSNDFPT
jgi:hypothetical protein